MSQVILNCKICGKPFMVDWEQEVESRTLPVFRWWRRRTAPKPGPYDRPLDLVCPHCGRKATYKRSDRKEVTQS